MHICIISYRNILGNGAWGGIHTHARNLTYLLLEKKHSVTMITGEGHAFREEMLSIITLEDERAEIENEYWLLKVEKICRSIHRKNHVHLICSEGMGAMGLGHFPVEQNIPIIAFVHLLNIHYFFNISYEISGIRSLCSYLAKGVPRFLYSIKYREAPFLRRCSKVITGSSAIARDLEKYYSLPDDKIHVIHNWIDTDKTDFNPSYRKEIRRIWKIQASDKVFLMVGNLWWPKGFHIALKAFERAVENAQTLSSFMVLIGDGMNRAGIEKIISKSRILKGRVRLTGKVPNEELTKYYSASDVFILPSIMNEVLPYTLLESMACRLPVIATDIRASREILGESVALVRCRDVPGMTGAILGKMFSEPGLLKNEGERNRRRIKQFFSKRVASEKIDGLLNGLIRI